MGARASKVSVDSAGKVVAIKPSDAQAAASLNRAAEEKVDGQAVPSRLTLPYQFGGGAAKRPEGNNKRGAKPPSIDLASMPVMTAVSAVPGIELAKLDYKAPDLAAPAK